MSSVKKSSSLETEVTVWAAYKIVVWFAELHESYNLFDFFPHFSSLCRISLGLRSFFPYFVIIFFF